jgi:hypothetical protein
MKNHRVAPFSKHFREVFSRQDSPIFKRKKALTHCAEWNDNLEAAQNQREVSHVPSVGHPSSKGQWPHWCSDSDEFFLTGPVEQALTLKQQDGHRSVSETLRSFKIRDDWHSSKTILLSPLLPKEGARGSVVGWGTMLQAGRSRNRVRMRWTISIYLILAAALWPCGRLSL